MQEAGYHDEGLRDQLRVQTYQPCYGASFDMKELIEHAVFSSALCQSEVKYYKIIHNKRRGQRPSQSTEFGTL